jgi:Icc-related predicted phosphoesterase
MLHAQRKHIKIYSMAVPLICGVVFLTVSGSTSWNTCILALVVCGFIVNTYYSALKRTAEEQHLKGRLRSVPENVNTRAIKAIQNAVAREDDFTFVVLGDSQRRHATFRRVLKHASSQNPDFIIHTGDVTTGGRLYQYKESLSAIRHSTVPMVFSPGNHDLSHNGERCFSMMIGPLDFYFDVGGYRFIIVNNCGESTSCGIAGLPDSRSPRMYATGIPDHTLRNIEALIETQQSCFIIMHMPPPIGPFQFHSFDLNSRQFLEMMQKHAGRVRCVFSGHIHGYGEIEHGGVAYVVTGGAGGRLRKNRDSIVARHHYVAVRVSGDTVTRQVQYVS